MDSFRNPNSILNDLRECDHQNSELLKLICDLGNEVAKRKLELRDIEHEGLQLERELVCCRADQVKRYLTSNEQIIVSDKHGNLYLSNLERNEGKFLFNSDQIVDLTEEEHEAFKVLEGELKHFTPEGRCKEDDKRVIIQLDDGGYVFMDVEICTLAQDIECSDIPSYQKNQLFRELVELEGETNLKLSEIRASLRKQI